MEQHDHSASDMQDQGTGEHRAWWWLLAAAAGVVAGVVAGSLIRDGRFVAGPLPLLAASSRAAAMIVCAGVLGSLAALLAALVALYRTPPVQREPAGHSRGGIVRLLPIVGTSAIVLFGLYTFYGIAGRAIGTGELSDQSNRVTWNQKNTARVGAAKDADTYAAALAIAYPPGAPERQAGSVVVVPDDWRAALAATPLIARPTNAAVVPRSESVAITAPRTVLQGGGPAIAAEVDRRMTSVFGRPSPSVVIVSADSAQLALPAAAYAARTGTPILFVAGGSVPQPTADALRTRGGRANLYVLGGIGDDVLQALRQFGSVRSVGDADPYRNAVAFASFRDPLRRFGWGRDAEGASRYSSSSVILVNPARWQDAIAGAHLARGGKSGPILFVERDDVPGAVDAYLWRQRPVFKATPAEGPFNSVWVVGSFARVSYQMQSWADYSQEIEQYMTLGDSALSAFEAWTVVWLAVGLAVAIFIAVHGSRRVGAMTPMMRMAWALFAVLLGPVALILYLHSYGRWETMQHDGMTMWKRSFFGQSVSATVMMFGFDMILMVLAVFLLGYFGFPIIRGEGGWYWLGTAMFLMMVGMYVIGLILMMVFFHGPMTMQEKRLTYAKALAAGFPMMLITMTVESLGMMPTMWWAQMYFLPAMQMPTEDDLTMWGTLIMAAMAGFIVVLPFNAWMVKRGAKMGGM